MKHNTGDLVFVRYRPTVDGSLVPLERAPLGMVLHVERALQIDGKPNGFTYYVMHRQVFDWYHESWLTPIK